MKRGLGMGLILGTLFLAGVQAKPGDPGKASLRGPAVGSKLPSLRAIAVNGPYRGKKQCYVAAYGQAPLLIAFLNPDYRAEVTALAGKLDALAKQFAPQGLKGVLVPVVGPEARVPLAGYVRIRRISLPVVYLEKGKKDPQLVAWKLPREAHNGVILARNGRVQAVFFNLQADHLEPLKKALQKLTR
jgi:hypothetical protein